MLLGARAYPSLVSSKGYCSKGNDVREQANEEVRSGPIKRKLATLHYYLTSPEQKRSMSEYCIDGLGELEVATSIASLIRLSPHKVFFAKSRNRIHSIILLFL